MNTTQKVTGLYETIKKEYGKEFADDELVNILYNEIRWGKMKYEDAKQLYNILT